MLIGVNPAETVWKPWADIQAERIRLDTETVTRRREEQIGRLQTLKVDATVVTAAQKQFDDALAHLGEELASLDRSPGQPEFQIGHLSWAIRAQVRDLYAKGTVTDAAEAMRLLVRHGCKGHRNLRDGGGNDLPFGFAAQAGAFSQLSEETFEVYAASGVVEALASVILQYNTLTAEKRKN